VHEKGFNSLAPVTAALQANQLMTCHWRPKIYGYMGAKLIQ
jgi:hypothetical protein